MNFHRSTLRPDGTTWPPVTPDPPPPPGYVDPLGDLDTDEDAPQGEPDAARPAPAPTMPTRVVG